MKKLLTRHENKVSGDTSHLSGDVTGLSGDVSGLSGYVTGLRGYVTGLSGYVSECELSDSDRAAGVEITTLIAV